ncbi:MAG: SpoU rRNA methylase family protein [uncultured bacterium]|nr:MAG: SpoU rRNA methylase family protein [uncultured bacterium]HBD05574.1 RNA methyltransferase [Candidatus Uhrbacteria bacterium]
MNKTANDEMRLVVLAHNIRSMHNVGSIFRSSECFGVEKIYLTGYTACPPRREINKVALGAEDIVRWEYSQEMLPLILELKKSGYEIVALETTKDSVSISDAAFSGRVALILGNEVNGIETDILALSDKVAHIEMKGKKSSLNVSVAAGIAMYALLCKSNKK